MKDKIDTSKFNWLTYEWSQGSYDVFGWDTYPESSVLAGQERRVFIDTFLTVDELMETYPDAEQSYERPQNYVNHLPNRDGYCNTIYDEGAY